MDHRGWDRPPSRLDDQDTWESNSSDEESSIGEYDGSDLPMHTTDVGPEDVISYEFPRDQLTVVLDGLSKWPWTVYPNHLTHCLSCAAKIVQSGAEETSPEFRRLQTLYREVVPSAFEKCLDDKAIWKWSDDIHVNIFDAVCRLMDLVVAKLPQLLLEDGGADDDLLPLLRSLAIGFDKQSQFHIKHKEQGTPPSYTLSQPHKFATSIPGTPVKQKNGEWYCSARKGTVRDVGSCECARCKPADLYSWLAYLLNHFGQTTYGNGYAYVLRVLNQPQNLLPAVIEAVLLPVAKSVEFLADDIAGAFLEPCNRLLHFVAELLERDVDALSDNTRDGSFGALSLILKHLQAIIGRSLVAEKAESLVSVVQRRMVERMLGFHSFNKQLSAVREINKLLENARSISSRDSSHSVYTTIHWLEKNDILRQILRSHLHHKQYVDQVEKIMRFLLQERRLSEEHLDAIWAATEKPDQFETVKANIFDLLADLAWSFSDEQLDSLFGRFERSQGRAASDIVKILSLVKKLARSDTKGVMASRLLELLWNMMHSGEAPAEILESGALTEILGHYDSVNCASKDVYISRCLKNIRNEDSVIPSLRLLREILLLDSEKPFYQGEVSRQMRLEELIKDYALTHTVVGSLEAYMALARSDPLDTPCSELPERSSLSTHGQYNHDEHVHERLDFLLFSLQSARSSLPWDVTERLWICMVESPDSKQDKEKFMWWLCEALDKWPALSFEAQRRLLTEKITLMDPTSLSATTWRCFTRLFRWVNINEEKLKQPCNEESTVTHDLHLVGLPYLWEIALNSPQEVIVDQSIHMLRDIHTCLSGNLQEQVIAIRQSFVDECLRYLTTALKRIEEENQMASPTSKPAGYSMSERIVEDKYMVRTSVKGVAHDDFLAASSLLGFSSQGQVQVERCLRLLRVFILRCEGRCPRRVPAHGASFQGRPLLLVVSTANKESTRFEVWVHANEYLASLRTKVAKRLECPVQRVRLTCLNRELTQDSQVLQQCGLVDGHPISAAVNIVERPPEAMDEEQLPGVLISKRDEIYEILFKLADASNASVREGANMMLSLLPTYPAVLADFQNLHTKSPEVATKQLAVHFGRQSRLLYILQVLDGILMPVNRGRDTNARNFREDFLRFGGFQHLLAVFDAEALPPGIDDQTRRGCYASGLRILKFLSSGQSQCTVIRHLETPSKPDHVSSRGPLLRTLLDIALRQMLLQLLNQQGEDLCGVVQAPKSIYTTGGPPEPEGNGGSEVIYMPGEFGAAVPNVTKEFGEVGELVDMPTVVRALQRLTWSAGLGQISAMSSCQSFSSSLKDLERIANLICVDEQEQDLDLDDEYICTEAMNLLVSCLLMRKQLLVPFFSSSETAQFIVDMVLYPPAECVRYRSAATLLELSKVGADSSVRQPAAHQYILAALLGAKEQANKQRKRCLHYWELLGQLLYSMEGPEEREMGEKQLVEELIWLKSAPAAIDENDRLLEGHLSLVQTLVEVLDRRNTGTVTASPEEGLVQQIIRSFLFLESALLWGNGEEVENVLFRGVRFGVIGGTHQGNALLQSKCGTRRSRERAFQLLVCLATHSLDNLREIVDLLMRIHFATEIPEWEHIPSYGRKAVGGYVGLKNAGATCYMNSVFQQLYMQPEVRRSVLACSECDDMEKQDSVFFQLQAMFGALLGSNLDHYTPQGFWLAYRDYDGLPINLREHQDAFEFFNRLYDTVDETLKATQQETTLTKIFGGIFVQQVICRGCPHRSERQEPFAAISVDVKNKRDLLESLESFVRGDLLEADNAYFCEECGMKVDALKRVCVKLLPHTLVIHLKRFDFDYETMQRLKLKDRFEFPVHLDMRQFTVEGLASHDNQDHATSSAEQKNFSCSAEGSTMQNVTMNLSPMSASNLNPDSYYKYELVGVVVHSGTAFAGHYYSYIKERPGDRPLNAPEEHAGGWIAFDDKRVEPYDIADLEKDCFGGKYTVDVYDNFLKTTTLQEFDRPNSAYMLLYERCQVEAAYPINTLAWTLTSSKGNGNVDESMSETQPPRMRRFEQMPASIHRSVWEENLRFVHENHLLDKDYFHFLHSIVNANSDIINGRLLRSSQVKSAAEEEADGARGGRIDGLGVGDRRLSDSEINEFARLTTKLATEFLLRVYLKTHSSLREDLQQWKNIMWTLVENNIHACRCFVLALVDKPYWIHQYLLKCPVDDIRQAFASMLVRTLQCAVSFLGGDSYLEDENGKHSDALFVDALMGLLISLLRDAATSKAYLPQYLGVVLEYAKIGTPQRLHLLQKSVVSQLAAFASKVNIQALKVDLACLHSTVSLLLRSCDISKLWDTFEGKGNMVHNTQERDRQPGFAQNPLQLPPLLPLPCDAIDVIFKHHTYISILIESYCDQEDVLKLLEFCCWQNETFSATLLQDILEILQRAISNEVTHLLALTLRLLQLKDFVQTLRQEIMLLGFQDFPRGVIDLIVVKAVNPQKRYALVKFVVKLVGFCPTARQYLLDRRAEWKRAVDWLQEELTTNSASALSVQPVSNDGLLNGYLQQTNTAEWILINAQNILSPSS